MMTPPRRWLRPPWWPAYDELPKRNKAELDEKGRQRALGGVKGGRAADVVYQGDDLPAMAAAARTGPRPAGAAAAAAPTDDGQASSAPIHIRCRRGRHQLDTHTHTPTSGNRRKPKKKLKRPSIVVGLFVCLFFFALLPCRSVQMALAKLQTHGPTPNNKQNVVFFWLAF